MALIRWTEKTLHEYPPVWKGGRFTDVEEAETVAKVLCVVENTPVFVVGFSHNRYELHIGETRFLAHSRFDPEKGEES